VIAAARGWPVNLGSDGTNLATQFASMIQQGALPVTGS
jgi:hypothetical protein